MTLSIGRCGLDVTCDEVETLDMDGRSVRLSGILYASSLADVKVLRQQLLGHVDNPDEPVVPVAWSEDSSIDGFYKVRAASVGTTAVSYAANWFPFSVDLERIHGTTITCLAEAIQTVALRTNSYGITTASWVALPFTNYSGILPAWIRNATTTSSALQTASSGEATMYTADATSLYPGASVMALNTPPSEWYTGACRVEVGSSSRKAVGRDIINDLSNWRISNGMVRVIGNGTTGSQLDIQWHNGSSWSSTKSFEITYGGAAYTGYGVAPRSVNILRNSVERVTVRLSVNIITIDLSIRRGARCVEVNVSYNNGISTLAHGVKRTSVEAATALTGGIRATSNDGDGNRYVITAGGSGAITNDLVNGRMYLSGTAATSWQFGISSEIGGSGAASFSTAQSQVYQYMAVWNETLRVVSR